jgi:streptogramin lyase
MVPASDGAVWASDLSCSRLIRFAPDGARAVFPLGDQFVDQMAADTVGGVWHLGSSRVVENVDSAGRATRVEVGGERATDVAVAPDGSVWLALGRCAIARVNGAALEFRRIPIPAQHIAFDPAGRVWLASRTRLVHSALDQLGGTCDNRGPQVRVMPGTGRRVRLGALHRAGALRLRVSEPAVLSGFAQFGEGRLVNVPERRIYRRNGGAIGVRVTGERLRRIERRLAAGRRTTITVSWDAVDREGNEASETVAMRVVR